MLKQAGSSLLALSPTARESAPRRTDSELLRLVDAQLYAGHLQPALALLERCPAPTPALTARLCHTLLMSGRAGEAANAAARALTRIGLDGATVDDLQAMQAFALALADPLAGHPIGADGPGGGATLAVVLSTMAGHLRQTGDLEKAVRMSARAVAAAEPAALPAWWVTVAAGHARHLLAVGALDEAADLVQATAATCSGPGPAAAYRHLPDVVAAEAHLLSGNTPEAGEIAERVLRAARAGEAGLVLPQVHRVLAQVALHNGCWDKARNHVHAIRVLLETGGVALWPLHPHWLDLQITLQQHGAEACARLLAADRYWAAGDTALAAEHPGAPLWFARTGREIGAQRLVEAAVATADELARRNPRTAALAEQAARVREAAAAGDAGPPPSPQPDWSGFSPAERRIAQLVADGLTNGQIANRIGLSAHTVNYHLRKMFRRLGISSRTELAGLRRSAYDG
ncbi:helix-turn-helix transcriptional regulator [Actinoplanes sp. NPDC051411]|uniref:helix-turn-helix transcriptional regulator n=1 Tax=Actinoplanes sp. NPDC051411 TaxID=3155522 RepID=UPI00342280D2